jgi:hypothetical protein
MRTASRGFVAVLLLAGAVLAYAAPASAGPAWSVVSSANPPGAPNGAFDSVACASPTSCFSVGSSVAGLLMEQYDGASWTIVDIPGTGSLNDIACASATSCFAVGSVGNGPLIESWDGTTWSITPSPTLTGPSALLSIACSSPTSCFAVGRAGAQVVALQWNGTTWTTVATPHPAKARSSYFVGVSCASASSCQAVGSSYDGVTARPLIEGWNGAVWSLVPGPVPTSTTLPVLNSVSCASGTSCFAVGSVEVFSAHASTTKTLIDRWNGVKWTVVASPNVGGTLSNSLADVSCSGPTSCFAVGSATLALGEVAHNLIEHWNGTSWTIGTGPNPAANGNSLGGVACPAATSCFAVGESGSVTAPGTIEQWNGTTWSIMGHPMPLPTNSSLLAAACAGPTCFSVGQQSTPAGTIATLVEQPTPSGWVVVPNPNPAGATAATLSGVSCPRTTLCVAVGTWSTKSASKTLVEIWNGSVWLIVPSPNHGTNPSGLTGVSCPSPTTCFAVGDFVSNGFHQTLTERWNGTTWTIVASPNLKPSPHFIGRHNDLASVSCANTTYCFAVGVDTNVAGGSGLGSKSYTLIERWNGSAWSIATSPNPGASYSALSSVSCPTATSCVAVGSFFSSGKGPLSQSLIVRWNGTTWARVASADPATARVTSLAGVSCTSAMNCFAVGGAAPGNSVYTPLVKSLAGTTWSNTAAPNPGGVSNNYLNAVTCPSPSTCIAVGSSGPGGQFKQTLVESYA